MDTHDPSSRTGVLIALVGALLLINLVLGSSLIMGLVSAALFALAGLAFLAIHRTEPDHWWALIPGLALLGLALASITGAFGGMFFLGAIGLAFAMIYRSDPEQWWALIPAGVLFTLALVSTVDALPIIDDGGFVFFLGLAATFAMVWRQADQQWAVWPMGAMLFMVSVIAMSALSAVSNALLPLLLIGGGLWLLFGRRERVAA